MPQFRIALNYEDINEEDEVHVEHDLGSMNIVCTSCGALYWEAERPASRPTLPCAKKGKVSLPQLRDPPAELYAMFADQTDPMHEEMHKNALKYNASYLHRFKRCRDIGYARQRAACIQDTWPDGSSHEQP